MSILRTIPSRPMGSQEAGHRRVRGRHLLIVTLFLGVSACAAVAADGLPGGAERPPQRLATEAQQTAGEGPRSQDSSALTTSTLAPSPPAPPPAPRQLSNQAALGATTERSRAQGIAGVGAARTADRGTIVAHAAVATVTARHQPTRTSDPVTEFANPTERGGPLVFQAVGEPTDGWLEVLLPVRPNGTTGWIELADVTLTRNPYRIEVDLEQYQLTVRRNGEVEIAAPVAIGQGGTPTPVGDFYLIELLQPPQANGPYGSYAYGLSGYSDVLDNFAGGEGVIGIHGTNRPDLLGGPASHGCIRIHNDTIELMAEFLPLGTPVSILEPDGEG